jgi:hypothetical protein
VFLGVASSKLKLSDLLCKVVGRKDNPNGRGVGINYGRSTSTSQLFKVHFGSSLFCMYCSVCILISSLNCSSDDCLVLYVELFLSFGFEIA